MKKSLIVLIVIIFTGLVIAGLIVAGRNEDSTEPIDSNTQNQQSQSQNEIDTFEEQNTTDQIEIDNSTFSPDTVTVKKGTTVKWINNDSTSHTVTADSGEGPDSGTMNQGDIYEYTFNETGTYAYHCELHRGMMGEVIVTE